MSHIKIFCPRNTNTKNYTEKFFMKQNRLSFQTLIKLTFLNQIFPIAF